MKILASPYSVKVNPYVDLFYSSLKRANSNVDIQPYRLRHFFNSIDICHFHWPESFLNASSAYLRIKGFLFLCIKIKLLKLLKVKIIWTVHNFSPHEKYSSSTLEELFYKYWLKNVDALIFLSRASQKKFFIKYSANIRSEVIPHGHYREIYKSIMPSTYFKKQFDIGKEDFIFGHYGLIRRYKNIPKLIQEFKKLDGDHYKLIIAGSVHKADELLEKEINYEAQSDSRVKLHLHFLKNEEMKELYSLTNIVILPFKDIVNSGSALLSLSMNCPIVVPNNVFMRELKSYISEENVFLFSGEFSFMDTGLKEFIIKNKLCGIDNNRVIGLRYFDWSNIGKMTAKFFHKIVR